ncbi:MAG: DUF4097 family beta strand repeat-containing protein [candidate division WOR-3 bacterium]
MKILKLLEEGKITAEEAARLLEAVRDSESKKKRNFFWEGMGSFSDIMSDMMGAIFSTSFKNHSTSEKIEIPGKKKLEFKGISGDLEIKGNDINNFIIEKDGIVRIYEENDVLLIKTISGDIKIDAPRNINVEIKGVSGDLIVENINGRIEILSVSGNIVGKGLSGRFVGEFVSGDVELEYQNVDGIVIKARSGDVVLKISDKTEAEIEISSMNGDIHCDFPLKDTIKKNNFLKGILNSPKAKILIDNRYGDVRIEKKI